MTVEFKTERGEFLLVKVPDEVSDFYISGTGHLCAYKPSRVAQVVCNDFMDMSGNYSIIGITSELTEADCKKIVEWKVINGFGSGWTDYVAEIENKWQLYGEAKPSFDSLLRSHEVYEKNPYGVEAPKIVRTKFYPFDENNEIKFLNWMEANERTGSWLLLKKIN